MSHLSQSLSHTLISKPFHGRSLSSNSINSIPSGAFTGLTALQNLWGRCYGFAWINCIIQYVIIPSLSGRVCFRFLCFHSDIYFPLTYSHLMQWCFALVSLSFLEIAKHFFHLSPLPKLYVDCMGEHGLDLCVLVVVWQALNEYYHILALISFSFLQMVYFPLF